MKIRKFSFRMLLLLTVTLLSGCATQSEVIRLQQEADDLSKQLEYEKKRLANIQKRLNETQEKTGGTAGSEMKSQPQGSNRSDSKTQN